jgi:processing peptidase subunit beta
MHRGNVRHAVAAAAKHTQQLVTSVENVSPKEIAAKLANLPQVNVSTLANGVRVVSEHLPHVTFSNIGVWIDAGSRFETRENNGTAHFLEHMNFKGSPKYTKRDIDTLFEHNGSHFNAYTARDRTAYYVKAFNHHVDPSMQLVSDILYNSNLEPRLVEAERGTILAEMRDVESLVDEVIMDNLHLCAFDSATSGLPLTILGPIRNVNKHIDRTMLRNFVETHYTGPRMNLVCSGGLKHEEVERIAQQHYGWLSAENNRPTIESSYVGGDHALWSLNTMTANMAWAIPICGMTNPDCLVMQVVHQIIGGYRREFYSLFKNMQGTTFNSRYADELVDELELINPFFTPYEETGLFGFYYVTVPSEKNADALERMLMSNLLQLQHLASHELDADRLQRVKTNFKAAHLLIMDGTTNRAEEMGRQFIQTGGFEPSVKLFERLDAITPQIIMETVAKYFVNARPTVSLVGNPKNLWGLDSTKFLAAKIQQATAGK